MNGFVDSEGDMQGLSFLSDFFLEEAKSSRVEFYVVFEGFRGSFRALFSLSSLIHSMPKVEIFMLISYSSLCKL